MNRKRTLCRHAFLLISSRCLCTIAIGNVVEPSSHEGITQREAITGVRGLRSDWLGGIVLVEQLNHLILTRTVLFKNDYLIRKALDWPVLVQVLLGRLSPDANEPIEVQNACFQTPNHILIWQTPASLLPSLVGQSSMALIRALCLSLLLLVVPPSLVIASDNPDALRVLHRIYHPSRPSEPFTDRGALILTRSGPAAATPHTFTAAVRGAHLLPHESLPQDLVGLEQAFQSILEELATKGLSASKASQEVLYQLALEHPGDTHHSQWHVSSVKAVSLLTTPPFESVILAEHRAA